ncbi:hypothetical protein F8M41_006608 [Gigaspora margarita]|uniref:Uncharacterized protein n=1 Tax=Gigaspora margarita TaxID=4874 RepID=A0A8H4A3N6_GIGMA|nr:hypothetical protein F8M41_006608 [Gigaspora margarita]
MYILVDDENQDCGINEKCRNKSDNVEYSDDMIIEAGNHWLDDLEAKVDQLFIGAEVNKEIKVADLREEIDVTWKKEIDNSIRLLIFWLNLVSITLHSYLSQVVKQSIEVDRYVKANNSGIKTISDEEEQFNNGGVALKNLIK